MSNISVASGSMPIYSIYKINSFIKLSVEGDILGMTIIIHYKFSHKEI